MTRDGLLAERDAAALRGPAAAPPTPPTLPDLRTGGGFTLDLWLEPVTPGPPGGREIILDTRDEAGRGLVLETGGAGGNVVLRLTLDDGRTQGAWDTDPGALGGRRPQHVVAVVDGGPKIIAFVVNGRLCDGGMSRQYGWGRFPPFLGDVTAAAPARIHPEVRRMRLYGRALRTSEAVGNFLAGPDG